MTSDPPAGAPAPRNVAAVVGFVMALLGFNVVSIILGGVALSQIRRTGGRGRGLALAAIWIGAITVVAFLAYLILATVVIQNMDNPDFR